MEKREILVANTNTQKRYKIETDATTLGELKKVLRDNNVEYEGMDFTEGISNVHLNDDNSQLPQNVTYKGKTTNNLIIMLTNTKKNIPLGVSGERAELFSFIKAHDLSEKVRNEFGKNMTQVSTSALADFVAEHKHEATDNNETDEKTVDTGTVEEKSELDSMADDVLSQYGINVDTGEIAPNAAPDDSKDSSLKDVDSYRKAALYVIKGVLDAFYQSGILGDDDYDEICDIVKGIYA